MGRFNTEPVSTSRHDVTSWIAGQTRLTFDESMEVHKAVMTCGLRSGKKRGDREKDAYRQAKCGIIPVIGLFMWLRICWNVWRAIQLLLDYYERPEETSGSTGD